MNDTTWPSARRHGPRAGQALAEFALVAPVVVLILAAILQFGLIFTSQIGLTNSVRETARYGSVVQVQSDGEATTLGPQVLSYLIAGTSSTSVTSTADIATLTACGSGGLLETNVHPFLCSLSNQPGLASATISYCEYQDPSSGSGSPTYSVRIIAAVTYNHPLLIPIVGNIIDAIDGSTTPGSFQLRASEQMRVENPPTLLSGALTATCP